MYKSLLASLFVCIVGIPTMAFFDAKITKTQFYDNVSTIMQSENTVKNIETLDYWSINHLYQNKYRPYYMLSNKELYKIGIKTDKSDTYRKSQIPGIYNISLKNSSIMNVSMNSQGRTINLRQQDVNSERAQNTVSNIYLEVYESAKAEGTETSDIISACISLKNSGQYINYDRAIDLLNRVTAKEPYNAYAYFLKGEIYGLKKDSQNAMKNYVESIRINPTNKACYKSIAKILEPTNKVLAQKYYQKSLN